MIASQRGRVHMPIIGFSVERADLCGISVCWMFNQIIAGRPPPRHLSSDYDRQLLAFTSL